MSAFTDNIREQAFKAEMDGKTTVRITVSLGDARQIANLIDENE